ncbi:MAG: tetratricopeptide repeat protein [Alphaproteobacteria bacterium]|nr:tetratricopeptide repeat protein [Alphaproteobacteria bacterium]
MPRPNRLFTEAREAHASGDLSGAEKLYREVLRADPGHTEAGGNLAVLLAVQGRLAESERIFARTVALPMVGADVLTNFGRFLITRRKRPADALEPLRRAAQMEPANAAIVVLLGQVLLDMQRFDEALSVLRGAADNTHTLRLLGKAAFFAGALEEAESCFARLAESDISDPVAPTFLGLCRHKVGDYAGALSLLDRALEIRPGFHDALTNRGTVLMEAGRHAEAWDAFGNALAAGCDPTPILANLGVLAHRIGDIPGSTFAFRAAERLNPRFPMLQTHISTMLVEAGAPNEALVAAEKALQARPDDPIANFNRAVSLLKLGHWSDGWAAYEWREKLPGFSLIGQPVHRRWCGPGDTVNRILVRAEQGLGDTLHFFRYAILLAEMGWSVVVEVQCPLLRLLRAASNRLVVVRKGCEPPACDAEVPLLSLPHLLGTQVAMYPPMPRLGATLCDIAIWREALGPRSGLRVGLAWAGCKSASFDGRRSLNPGDLCDLLDIEGVEFVSLDIERSPPACNVRSFAALISDFADTAALIEHLDLVIAVDTAVAHLSAAMGKPTWLLNRQDGCWRWLADGNDSPWYPSIRLFRQSARGDWAPVLQHVATALRHWVREGRQCCEPSDPIRIVLARMNGTFIPNLLVHAAARLHERGLHDASDLLHDLVLEQMPTNSAALVNAARNLLTRRAFAAADVLLRRALALWPENGNAWLNIGVAWQNCGRIEEAVVAYGRAAELVHQLPEALNNLAKAHLHLNRVDDAVKSARAAVAANQEEADAHFTLALALLTQGNYEEGWPEYEWRWNLPNVRTHWNVKAPLWAGQPLEGKRLLAYSEQGFGDNIQFVRFLLDSRCRDAHITLLVPGPLFRLMDRAGVADAVASDPGDVGPIDYCLPLMSFPHVLETTINSIPARVPYLRVPKDISSEWAKKVARSDREVAVGLVWAGNGTTDDPDALDMDKKRSLALEMFAPLVSVPRVQFYCLQKEFPSGSMVDMLERLSIRRVMTPDCDFLDTAAIIDQLDLVITVDTAVAHLAGALGRPIWVASRFDSCWRWPRQSDTTPWYPTARVFHQPRSGQWQPVIESMRVDLARWIGRVGGNRPDVNA